MNRLEWIPGVSCGPYTIGARLDELPEAESFNLDPSLNDSAVDSESYVNDCGVRLEVRGGMIESVSSSSSFFFRDTNLIGVAFQDAEELLEASPDFVDDIYEDDSLVIVDFDPLGLQLCISRGIVRSATCY